MGRYFEVDAFRGIALISMIIYHTLCCLFFFTANVPWFNPAVQTGAPIATAFVGIAGLSLVLARKPVKKYLIRGAELIGLGLVITLVTWIFYPSGFVVFGILSLIGLGTILAIPFVAEKVPWFAPAILGIVLILLNLVVSQTIVNVPYLLPLGFMPYGFHSIDYEPLIPWFGIMLLGMTAGKLLYPHGIRLPVLERLGSGPKLLRPLCFIGRHTLIVYMVHVPLILGILVLFGIIPLSAFF